MAGLAAVAVILLVLPWLRLPSRARRFLYLVTLGAAAVAYFIHRFSDVTQMRIRFDDTLPANQQTWVMTATVTLTAIGLAAAAVFVVTDFLSPANGLSAGRVPPGGWGTVGIALGAVAAVTIAATVTSTALRKGDDSEFVMSSTAAATEILPRPNRLGRQLFQLPWPRVMPSDATKRPRAAGAGFVALLDASGAGGKRPTLIGFGSDGSQRWHYARTGPGHMVIHDFAVYDNGGVVLVDESTTETPFVAALDALTGVPLWSSQDPTLVSVFDAPSDQNSSPFLVTRRDERWSAFNPRTGERIWQIPNPVRCPQPVPGDVLQSLYPALPYYVVDSPARMTTINDCSTEERIILREISVDPATGKVIDERPVPGVDAGSPEEAMHWYAGPQGTDGYTAHVTWRERRPALEVFVDTPTGRHVDLGDGGTLASFEPDGGFLTRYGRTMRQFSGMGDFVCEYVLPSDYHVSVGMLAEQILVIDDTMGQQRELIRLIDRSDCRETGTVPVPPRSGSGGYLTFSAVPGATVLLHKGIDTTGTLFGFGPA